MSRVIYRFCMLSIFGIFLMACHHSPKKLAVVTTGMSKGEVLGMVGEPKNKNIINETEVWDYPDSSRTIIFRMDTVYTIITSPSARADSLGKWLDKTDKKVKDQLGEVADKAGEAGKKLINKVQDDSVKVK